MLGKTHLLRRAEQLDKAEAVLRDLLSQLLSRHDALDGGVSVLPGLALRLCLKLFRHPFQQSRQR